MNARDDLCIVSLFEGSRYLFVSVGFDVGCSRES